MAYSKYVTEFNDKDNNTYGVMDAEGREATEQLKDALDFTDLLKYSVSVETAYYDTARHNSTNWQTFLIPRSRVKYIKRISSYPMGTGSGIYQVAFYNGTPGGSASSTFVSGIQFPTTGTNAVELFDVKIPDGATVIAISNRITSGTAIATGAVNEDIKAPAIYETASGAVASFEDGADDMPLKSLLVNIAPIQSGTGDPSPSNVRPITGFTGLNVLHGAESIIDGVTFEDGYYDASGGAVSSGSMMRTADYIPVTPGESYMIAIVNGNSSGGSKIRVIEYDSSKNAITPAIESNGIAKLTYGDVQWTASENAAYIRFSHPKPYNGKNSAIHKAEKIAITFPETAGTVYGGTLDVVSGVLTVDRATIRLSSYTNWSAYGTAGTTRYFRITSQGDNPLLLSENSSGLISNALKWYTVTTETTEQNIIWVQASNRRIAVRLSNAMDVSSGTDFLAAIAEIETAIGEPLVFSAKLATPVVYQLTPIEVRTLLGANSIWSNTGDTTAVYPADTATALNNAAAKRIDSVESSIANVEPDSVVEENHPEGDVFFVGDTLVKATEAIPAGEDAAGSVEPITVKEYVDAGLADLDERKVNPNGYYEELVSGAAEQLIATQNVTDSEPYFYRPTGGGADVEDREYLEAIVGGSAYWNQLREDSAKTLTADGITASYDATTHLVTIRNDSRTTNFASGSTSFNLSLIAPVAGHKYLYLSDATQVQGVCVVQLYGSGMIRQTDQINSIVVGNENESTRFNLRITSAYDFVTAHPVDDEFKFHLNIFDLTLMFGSTVADYIYSLEQATTGAGVNYFRRLFPASYYPYSAGEMINVTGLTAHNTFGFNLWDEVWETGYIKVADGTNTAGSSNIRSKNFIPVIPGETYYLRTNYTTVAYSPVIFYDKDKNFISSSSQQLWNRTITIPTGCFFIRFYMHSGYGAVYNHDICINFSHSGTRDGEYQPHVEHSYPLDSSVTLYGVMRIGADGKPYYDGDTYESDGTVTRVWRVIDPQNITWSFSSTNQRFNSNALRNEGITSTMSTGSLAHWGDLVFAGPDIFYFQSANNGNIRINLSANPQLTSESDVNSFFPEGSYILLRRVTPVIEYAAPYDRVQVIDDFGSEEFVSTGILPPGHNTQYLANLRDKVQHLPSPASSNGHYVISQTNGQMSLAPVTDAKELPDVPGTDGTYRLKATVTNGQLTLSWESAT